MIGRTKRFDRGPDTRTDIFTAVLPPLLMSNATSFPLISAAAADVLRHTDAFIFVRTKPDFEVFCRTRCANHVR